MVGTQRGDYCVVSDEDGKVCWQPTAESKAKALAMSRLVEM